VYVINKADRDGANQVRRELRTMLGMADQLEGDWRPPIVRTVATKAEGVDELAAKIAEHRAWANESGELERRRVRRARDEIEAIAVTELRSRFADLHGDERLDRLAKAVTQGKLDPYSAAEDIVASM
ncbi:MAG: methylmalonyl Co-A mutase-associated GTPase MeaB, partial [Nocardioidaceae bacterium]